MQRFKADHPGFALELETGNTTEVAQWVGEATVDLGFVEGEVDDPRLTVRPLPGDELALVVAPGDPWASQPPRTAAELAAHPWVLREHGSATRAVCEAALGRHGLTTNEIAITLELPSNEAVRAGVEAGAGATVLSTLVVAPSIQSGRLVRVPFDLPPRQFFVLRYTARHVPLAEQRFLDLVTAP